MHNIAQYKQKYDFMRTIIRIVALQEYEILNLE